jgi:hypothetical protein
VQTTESTNAVHATRHHEIESTNVLEYVEVGAIRYRRAIDETIRGIQLGHIL